MTPEDWARASKVARIASAIDAELRETAVNPAGLLARALTRETLELGEYDVADAGGERGG